MSKEELKTIYEKMAKEELIEIIINFFNTSKELLKENEQLKKESKKCISY